MAKKYLDNEGLLYLWQKIKAKLSEKVDKEEGKGLSTNDYTTEEKTKLEGIATGATKVIVDAALNGTSTNAIQNKAVNEALGNKVDVVPGKGLSTNDLTDELLEKLNNAGDSSFSGNYKDLTNKPSINGQELIGGNNTLSSLGIQASESGKGLSTNDYTTEEKTKLEEIEAKAQVNKIEQIKVNGTAQTITSKAVNITVPTSNAQLENGAGYQTAAQVNALIATAVGDITGIEYQVVASLPATGEAGVIYLVSNSGSNPNSYDEYIYVNDKFEKIGTTDVDLSGYLKTSDLVPITNAEIDTIMLS